MTIESKRLIFSKLAKEDIDIYFQIYGSIDTNIYNPKGPIKTKKLAQVKLNNVVNHWSKYGFGFWKIATKDKPEEIIGFGGLCYILYDDVERLNLGYRFIKKGWGKGYATEFAQRTIEFGFEDIGLTDIYAIVLANNIASINVLEKCLFKSFGSLKSVPKQAETLVFKTSKNK